MKIGVSLPPALLCGAASSAHQEKLLEHGVPPFLTRLRKAGCTHIELRAVRSDTPEDIVTGAARALRSAGLQMTVHGVLTDEPAEAFWKRLHPLLAVQSDLCVTVHSVSSRETTVSLLRRLSEYAACRQPGARLALENNRSKKGDNIDLVECAGVYSTILETGMNNIGVCWDFGHFRWDVLTHPALLPDALPPRAFAERAIHTHIHSVYADTTHFPLTMGELPLADYVRLLTESGYTGVYNLEPEPERWDASIDAAREIIRSVELLKETVLRIKEELK